MATASLPRYVAAPALEKPKFSLESVVRWQDSTSVHDFLGIQFQPDTCGPAVLTNGLFCADIPDPTDPYGIPKTTENGVPLVVGSPFTVYGYFECSPIGFDFTEAAARARAHLDNGGSRAMERALQLGEAGNEPALVSEAVDITPSNVAVNIVTAIATAEQYIRANYGGTGVIYLTPALATLAGANFLLWADGDTLRTNLGTPVAIVAGFDNTGPTGNTTTGEDSWVWVTGALYGWRDAPQDFPDTMAGALNKGTNDLITLSEQLVVLAFECAAAAVGVDTVSAGTGEDVNVTNFPATQNVAGTVALDAPTLAALETIQVGSLPTAQRTKSTVRVNTATTTNVAAGARRIAVTVVAAASAASPTVDGVAIPYGTTWYVEADGANTLPATAVVTVSGDDVIIVSVT